MLRLVAPIAVLLVLRAGALPAETFTERRDANWHQWRGPMADGVAPHGDPPIEWAEDKNVRWKVEVPGEGSATPIVWEDQVILLAAVPTDRQAEVAPQAAADAKTEPPANYHQFVVLSLDRATGRERWRQVACEVVPHEGRHSTNTYASGSPTTDGERIYASFGSRGMFCYDLNGNLLWQRELGRLRTRYGWGEGASPAVFEDAVVVTCDQEEGSFVAVLDAATGEPRWRAERTEPTSWATPLVLEHGGRRQAIVHGANRVRSYDLDSGTILWECGGQTINAIPSPVAVGETVVAMSGYRGAAAFAIPLDAEGDITGTDRVVWGHAAGTPYVPSPLPYEGLLYFTAANTSVLTCLDVATGEPIYERERLEGLGNVYASPVAAAGRIYFLGREGAAVVLRHGRDLEVLATNQLDEGFDASPAIVGRQMFLRGKRHLYCIEEP
jgi:outer membrane protein assembly factor BamB